jgi:NADH-quinone oxidoreductase subunit C
MSDSTTSPATRLETLEAALRASLGEAIRSLTVRLGEITVVIDAAQQVAVATRLRDDPVLRFDTLIDLCGIDYLDYGGGGRGGPRFAVVMHLLSVVQNWRVRVRAFCADDEFPVIASVTGVWPTANWFEREAFDLYGIIFEGHADLRRILTDYGFVGHPFRKDFPVSGHVEMRYDPEQKRVIYQPVTIEPREIVPRVVRDERYGFERPEAGLRGQK